MKMMQKVVILGAGESGVGAALLAKKEGCAVWVSDGGNIKTVFRSVLEENNIAFEEGRHTIEKFFDADIIVKSPGIPEKASVIQQLRSANKQIISEIEFAYRFTDARIIAITGSNGKTTTTSLIYHILKESGVDVGLGGNIGNSFAKLVAEKPHAWYVLEISSFQLDDIDTFKPHIGLLLNITPDHLDRYGYEMRNYAQAKMRIAKNQTSSDIFIYGHEDEWNQKMVAEATTEAQKLSFGLAAAGDAFIEGNKLIAAAFDTDRIELDYTTLSLEGQHNALNVLAAILAAQACGIKSQDIQDALQSFQPIEHRLEPVATIAGISYINDSKATNIDAVWYALDAMQKPTVWILGGLDKGNDYAIIETLVRDKVKAIVVLAKEKEKFFQAFETVIPHIVGADNMEEAVAKATQFAESGDTILLSPACSSFDLFENYARRGELFKEAVKELRIENE